MWGFRETGLGGPTACTSVWRRQKARSRLAGGQVGEKAADCRVGPPDRSRDISGGHASTVKVLHQPGVGQRHPRPLARTEFGGEASGQVGADTSLKPPAPFRVSRQIQLGSAQSEEQLRCRIRVENVQKGLDRAHAGPREQRFFHQRCMELSLTRRSGGKQRAISATIATSVIRSSRARTKASNSGSRSILQRVPGRCRAIHGSTGGRSSSRSARPSSAAGVRTATSSFAKARATRAS